MKKILLFTAILFASITMGNAHVQNEKLSKTDRTHNSVMQGQKLKASTNLTIILNPIQSISVNTSNVSLVYTTVSDYTEGVRSGVINDHLQVYSTGGYEVNAGYSNAGDSGYDATAVGGLDAEKMFQSINIAVTKKATAFATNTKLQPLGATNGTIISSDQGVFGGTFDVDYQGASTYMNSIKEGSQRTYTAQVTYTITPS